jgi:cell division protein FtsZ
MANERTTWKDAFKMADQVLYMGVRGVTDLMMAPGLVNLDFADIRTVMAEMGKAMMGTGEADGENRAIRAAEAAISNPLLEDTSMAGARGLLINITGGEDLTLFEVDQAANRIREEVDEDANIIFGSAIDETLTGRIRVSVVATGIDTPVKAEQRPRLVAVGGSAMPAPAPIPVPGHGNPATVAAFAPAPGMATLRQPSAAQSVGEAGAVPALADVSASAAQVAAAQPASVGSASRLAVPATQPAGRGSLFADPRPTAVPPLQPVQNDAPRAPSLFSTVTGAFRRRAAGPMPQAAFAPERHEPVVQEPRLEAPRASVRQAGGDEVALDIPAFLRRQSS